MNTYSLRHRNYRAARFYRYTMIPILRAVAVILGLVAIVLSAAIIGHWYFSLLAYSPYHATNIQLAMIGTFGGASAYPLTY